MVERLATGQLHCKKISTGIGATFAVVFLALFLPAVLAGCRGATALTASGTGSGPRLSGTAASSGFLLFMTGSVEIEHGTSWQPATIGDELAPPQRIRTGASSVAEMQLAGTAAVMLLENTVVGLESGPAGTTSVHLESGSIIARSAGASAGQAPGSAGSPANPAAGGTPGASPPSGNAPAGSPPAGNPPAGAGIRIRSANNIISALDASVTVEQGRDTRIAVTSGSARILTTGVDPAEIAAATGDASIRDKLMTLAGSGVVVGEGREVTIPYGAGDTNRHVLDDVIARVAPNATIAGSEAAGSAPSSGSSGSSGSGASAGAQATKPAPTLSGSDRTLIAQLLVYVGQRAKADVPADAPVSPEVKKKLEESPPIRIVPTTPASGGAEFAASGLARVTIHTDPPDAEILLGGHNIGKTIFSGLFRQDEKVTFTVHKSGYDDKDVEVTFTHDLNRDITVTLQRAKPAVSMKELFSGIAADNPAVLTRYLNTGGDPNARGPGNLTPLSVALGADRMNVQTMSLPIQPDMVSQLLAAGADPNAGVRVGNQEFTPLFLLVAAGLANDSVNLPLAEGLMHAGADPNVYIQTGNLQVNTLGMAIIVGIERKKPDLALIKQLLEGGAHVDSVIVYEGRIMAPLVASVVLGAENKFVDPALVKTLLENGAPVNARVNIDGEIGTPLYFAKKYQFSEIASLLAQFGAHA